LAASIAQKQSASAIPERGAADRVNAFLRAEIEDLRAEQRGLAAAAAAANEAVRLHLQEAAREQQRSREAQERAVSELRVDLSQEVRTMLRENRSSSDGSRPKSLDGSGQFSGEVISMQQSLREMQSRQDALQSQIEASSARVEQQLTMNIEQRMQLAVQEVQELAVQLRRNPEDFSNQLDALGAQLDSVCQRQEAQAQAFSSELQVHSQTVGAELKTYSQVNLEAMRSEMMDLFESNSEDDEVGPPSPNDVSGLSHDTALHVRDALLALQGEMKNIDSENKRVEQTCSSLDARRELQCAQLNTKIDKNYNDVSTLAAQLYKLEECLRGVDLRSHVADVKHVGQQLAKCEADIVFLQSLDGERKRNIAFLEQTVTSGTEQHNDALMQSIQENKVRLDQIDSRGLALGCQLDTLQSVVQKQQSNEIDNATRYVFQMATRWTFT
jgi:hypothetical protein